MLIICDFDGTITLRDITDIVWERWIDTEERQRMVEYVLSNRWRMHEYIAHGYAQVRASSKQLAEWLRQCVQIRNGWHRFMNAAASEGIPLVIVSNGLDFYIRLFVPGDVPVHSLEARFVGNIEAKLPWDCRLATGEEFKANRVKALIEQHSGHNTVFIGDGRADFEPALLCDRVFAVRDSRLAGLCKERCVPIIEFDTFDTITDTLNAPSRPSSARIVRAPQLKGADEIIGERKQ